MKKRHIFSLILIILVVVLSLNTYFCNKQNNAFQFKQERIDQQFSTTLSLLCTELFDTQPVDETAIIELKAQLQLLLPLTTYLEITDMENIADVLISAADYPTDLPNGFHSDLIEELEYFVNSLGKPLPNDINTQSKSIYSALSALPD